MLNLFSQYKGLKRENYILFIGRIVTNLGSMIWPVLTLILNQKLGYNATTVSLIMVLAGAFQVPFNIIGGKLADKYNKKYIIIFCDLVSILFFLICAFIPLSFISIIMLMIGSTVQSMEYPSYNALIADITKTENREKAYSLMYLGGNLGLIASPIIAGYLFKEYLWLSFIISGVAIAISTILIFFLVKDITPVEENNKYQQKQDNTSTFKILKQNKTIFLFIIISCIFWAAYSQYTFLLPLDMARVHGDDGASIYGTVSSINCIIVVVFTPIITSVFKKVSYTFKCLIGTLLIGIGYGVFVIGIGYIPVYYAAMILFTWGEIFSTIMSDPYITERIPESHRGRINGTMSVFQLCFQGIVVVSTGVLYDLGNNGPLYAWILVISLIILVAIGSIFIIFLDKKAYPNLYKNKVN